jgi:uncharacterized membrane protein YbaN (DUF454 family)
MTDFQLNGKMHHKLKRIILLLIGSIALGMGFLGLFLPLLPTTPFILLSAYCFASSSKRFYNYLLKHKVFGEILTNFYEKRIITCKTKIVALATMWTSLLASMYFFMPFYWVRILLILIGIGVTVYLGRFPSKSSV